MNLIIPLKHVYFDEIQSGLKTKEYRLRNEYWRKKLENRQYDNIILTRAYPKRSDSHLRMVRPWKGYVIETITHPHFGPAPVEVYAIDVG